MNPWFVFLWIIAGLFVLMGIVAVLKKPGSVYKNDKSQQNPMQGKMVRFVENEAEEENADGVRGHLEAVGNSCHQAGLYEKVFKRMLDIIVSFCGMIILSPVFLFLSLWILIEDPGAVIFTQKRIGKDKQYFKLHKFRSMKRDAPHNVPTHMLKKSEQYLTKSGRFMRAHSLDELPQLWDIFIGNMSIVGPRPGLWNQELLTAERDKWGANDIKPGLTGWAQINGRDRLEIPEKSRLDGEYTKHLSFKMDCKCCLGSFHVFWKEDDIL